jgi:integrase
MARKVKGYSIDSATARALLTPRAKGYYTLSAGRGKTFGYVRKANAAGRWIVRERIAGKATIRSIGTADDFIGTPAVQLRANGVDVLDYAQAQRQFTDPDVIAKASVSGAAMTVGAALDQYLVFLRAAGDYGDDTARSINLRIRPALGHLQVAKLTKSIVEAWLNGLVRKSGDAEQRRASKCTANRYFSILRAALNKAADDDANGISVRGWAKVAPFKRVYRARTDHFDAAQVQQWCDAADELVGAWLSNALRAGFLTGARYGELRALDVRDFDGATLHVRGVLAGAKKTGERTITLDPTTRAWMRELVKGRSGNAPLLCGYTADSRLTKWTSVLLKRTLERAELPSSAVFYTLRHSYISRAIEAGVSLKVIAENCGTSLLMIEKNYSKVLASARQEHIDRLGSVLHMPPRVVKQKRAA